MLRDYPWYDEVNGSELQQGDIFMSCPVLQPSTQFLSEQKAPRENLVAQRRDQDVVIMSQSCDLANSKIELAVVCPHWSLPEFEAAEPHFRSNAAKESLRRGNVTGFHLLAAPLNPDFPIGLRVVSFRTVYSVSIEFLRQMAAMQTKRLRLLPPYREHLAQAFARFFMRVGLPADIPPFK